MSLSKNTELLICRGCLATDARLYDMRQNRLLEAYSTLLSTAMEVTDDLPHYLCSYCAVLLLKCDTFRTKCIDAQVAFKNSVLFSYNTSVAYTKNHQQFRQSYTQTIDIDDNNTKSTDPDHLHNTLKVEINDDINNFTHDNFNSQINYLLNRIINSDKYGDAGVNDLIKEFKVCLDSDELKQSASNIKKQEMDQLSKIINKIQYSSRIKSELLEILEDYKRKVSRTTNSKNRIKTLASKDETKLHIEYPVTSESKQNAVKNENLHSINDITLVKEFVLIKNYNNKIELKSVDEFENTGEINVVSSDTEDEMAITDLKIVSKQSKCTLTIPSANLKPTKDCKAIKNGKPKANAKEKTNYVSKLYNMNEIDLCEEEQLKEIEDRKNSDSYMQARFKCDFCYKGFRIEESFKTHMVIHDDKSGKYVCDLCHCHFINNTRLKKHRYNHKKRYNCKECTYVTKYLSQAREHYKWHGGVKDTCKHCGKECSGQSNYYLHLKRYHPTSNDLVRCEICGESCSGPLGFKIHENRAHKEMNSPECLCPGCDTQFYCSAAFKAHQGTDGLCDATHKYCVRCGMAFETEQLLEKHEAEQRKPRTMFKCEVNQHCLKQHYLNKHSTESPFKCTECPKSFRCALNLQLHTRTHTGERPYKCKYCQKAFKSCANMKRHELVHSGERPHSCDICGKSFQTTHNVKAHIKTVHNQIRRPPSIRRRNKKN